MQNYSRVGGILNLVGGGLTALIGIGLIILGIVFACVIKGEAGYSSEAELVFITAVYVVLGVITVILGVFGIVGGVFALKRKHWGWALAGAICNSLGFFPCGIPALVFISLGRGEFNAAEAVPPEMS
jgi:hypothetical protein